MQGERDDPHDPSGVEPSPPDPGWRFLALLLCLGAAFLVQGIAPWSPAARGAVTLLLGATLLLSFWAGHLSPRRLRIAALPVVGGAVFLLASLVAGKGDAAFRAEALAHTLLVAVAPPAVVAGLLRSLRTHRAVTLDMVFGALCLYLLLGMFFAFVYALIDGFGGRPVFADGLPATPSRCLYFSLTTLTTVGYGDFTTRSDLGHTVSVLEALLGQLYLVTVVAVLVTKLTPPPPPELLRPPLPRRGR